MFKQTKEFCKDTYSCVGCGAKPYVFHYDYNMWYAECSNPDCKKFVRWSCLGASKRLALEAWESMNRPINRYYQKDKKDADDNTKPRNA